MTNQERIEQIIFLAKQINLSFEIAEKTCIDLGQQMAERQIVIEKLNAQIERLSSPVTDEEWFRWCNPAYACRNAVDQILYARRTPEKEPKP